MFRLFRFVVANLCILGVVGWLQWSLFDPDGARTTMSQWIARTGLRTHKRGPRPRQS